ncbi:iron-sulfur cluster co-chaperone HscB C-terminal domain-containing protein, partial [Acinetobacter baumannii]
KDPLKRAAYLCELRGAPVQAENNTAMPPAFLMQQMAWREALDDAITEAALEALDDEAAQAEAAALAQVQRLLDDNH